MQTGGIEFLLRRDVTNTLGFYPLRRIVFVSFGAFVTLGRTCIGKSAFLAGLQHTAGVVAVFGFRLLFFDFLETGFRTGHRVRRSHCATRTSPAFSAVARVQKAAGWTKSEITLNHCGPGVFDLCPALAGLV